MIETAGPLLQRSKTHAAAGSEATKGRTSLTCHLAKNNYPCPVLLDKIQALTNKPFGHMELPQVHDCTCTVPSHLFVIHPAFLPDALPIPSARPPLLSQVHTLHRPTQTAAAL